MPNTVHLVAKPLLQEMIILLEICLANFLGNLRVPSWEFPLDHPNRAIRTFLVKAELLRQFVKQRGLDLILQQRKHATVSDVQVRQTLLQKICGAVHNFLS